MLCSLLKVHENAGYLGRSNFSTKFEKYIFDLEWSTNHVQCKEWKMRGLAGSMYAVSRTVMRVFQGRVSFPVSYSQEHRSLNSDEVGRRCICAQFLNLPWLVFKVTDPCQIQYTYIDVLVEQSSW